jgi:hypothetical protein
MEKVFFGNLKSYVEILKSDGWSELVFLDYNDKFDLIVQLKEKLDFIRDNECHWVEIEKSSNDYLYWKNDKKQTIIISDDWLSERRD